MGRIVSREEMNEVFSALKEEYVLFGPKRLEGMGAYAGTDCIRYEELDTIEELEVKEKSAFTFKEILTPVSETLFYFTEDEVLVPKARPRKPLVFLRACDLHGIKVLDDMYLHNGPEDFYYKRLREGMKVVLMGCSKSFTNCFCVSMGTNRAETYDMSLDVKEDGIYLDFKDEELARLFEGRGVEREVSPEYVTENEITVTVPEDLDPRVISASMWEQYDKRCIACGRCNFSCPTCTCYSMQDIFYQDNGRAGERRRVQASCMVDGFTDVAGGGSYRKKHGERMRFKVLHKVFDYKKRKGYHMCVGCGRCDDVCPEYISFAHAVNLLGPAMEEVKK